MNKYEILEKIGQGSTSRVLLVRHKKLDALRAVKCISREHPDPETILLEGRVLQNLNHPGIPRIYDVEEDAHTIYLIEEYVAGESLQTIRSVQSNFSQERIIGYGMELCNILQYLHQQQPFPLIYLDLKPEHIIVTRTGIKIVDFGSVTEARQMDSRAGILGTYGFCAPEILEGKPPGIQSDVYGVGAVLYYLLYGQVYSVNEKRGFLRKEKYNRLERIIEKCLAVEEKRYKNMQLLKQALQAVKKENSKESSSLKIAVLGAERRVGVTHFSIGLTSYLNKSGRSAVYRDRTGKNMTDTILEHCQAEEDAGLMKCQDFCGIPEYGPGISMELEENIVEILDFGSDFSEQTEYIRECDRIYYLLGSSLWEPVGFGRLYDALKDLSLNVVVPFCLTEKNKKKLKEAGIKSCFVMPFFQDIWKVGEKTAEFYRRVWNSKV